MSPFWRLVAVMAACLALLGYALMLQATSSGPDPRPRAPIVVPEGPTQPVTPPDRDDAGDDDDGVRVVRPHPAPVEGPRTGPRVDDDDARGDRDDGRDDDGDDDGDDDDD